MAIAQVMAETAETHWASMVEALEAAEEARRLAEQLSIRLLAENDLLRNELTDTRAELKIWKSYAITVDTKLEIAANVIETARNAAKEQARAMAQEPDLIEPSNVVGGPIIAATVQGSVPEQDMAEDSFRLYAPPSARLPVNQMRLREG